MGIYHDTMLTFETGVLFDALRKHNGNVIAAAKHLGLSPASSKRPTSGPAL
jgi:transcriptional regulator with PAS, ATPase and Fis domain